MIKKHFWFFGMVFAICIVLSGCAIFSRTGAHNNTAAKVIENISENLAVYDSALVLYSEGLDLFDRYIDGEISLGKLTDELSAIRERHSAYSGIKADSALKEASLQEMPEELAIGELIDTLIQDQASELEFLAQYLEISVDYKNTKHKYVDIYRSIAKNETEILWYSTNEYLFQAGYKDAPKALKEYAAGLQNFSELSINWGQNIDEIIKQEEFRYAQYDALQRELSVMLGDLSLDVNKQTQEYEQTYEDTIRAIMERDSVPRELAEKTYELESLKYELEEKRQLIREKFAPSVENDSGTLLGKAARFAKVGMYEDALNCIDVFLSKEDDPDCPKICGKALQALYNSAGETEDVYGLLVVVVSGDKEYYQNGDIIIEIDSTPIYSDQEYLDTSDLREDGYDVIVLRLNAAGELEKIKITVPADANLSFSGKSIIS